MKKILKVFPIILILAALITGCAFEPIAGVKFDPGVLVQFVLELITLGVLSALVVLLVQIGKAVHLVKDGTADKWSMWLSLGVMVGAITLKIFKPDLLASTVSEYVNYIIEAAVVVFAFMGIQLPTAKAIYENVRGLPFIGYSFTLNQAKK